MVCEGTHNLPIPRDERSHVGAGAEAHDAVRGATANAVLALAESGSRRGTTVSENNMPDWIAAAGAGLLAGSALVMGSLIAWFVRVPAPVVAAVMAFHLLAALTLHHAG